MMLRSPAWDDVVYWVLDLETGGLDPARDPVLSVGMVPVRDGIVKVGESFYSLIKADGRVGSDSVMVHHILPGELAGAPPQDEVVEEIDSRLREGVLVVHFAAMDVPFLRRLYKGVGRPWPRPRIVDTAALADRLSRRLFEDSSEATADLSQIRAHLGLPRYTEHHALSDALATAELFLVLRHRADARTLRDLI
jgi:DNA polymerase-3 subunit epsilon